MGFTKYLTYFLPFVYLFFFRCASQRKGLKNLKCSQKFRYQTPTHLSTYAYGPQISTHTRTHHAHKHTLAPLGGCGFASHEGSRPCGQIPAHDCRSLRETPHGHGRRLPPETSGMESHFCVRRVSSTVCCANLKQLLAAIVVWAGVGT